MTNDIQVRPLTEKLIQDAEGLFARSRETAGCFCMWFIIPVVEYHAGGAEANRQLFRDLVHSSPEPVGLLAYQGEEVVGWCAAGPRKRFTRALKVPSFKGRDPSEDESVWLVPCFFVLKHARRVGVSRALLHGAVEMASKSGAAAVEGFPFARGAKLGRESMVGLEAVFGSCGFVPGRRPSSSRVVMRKELGTLPKEAKLRDGTPA